MSSRRTETTLHDFDQSVIGQIMKKIRKNKQQGMFHANVNHNQLYAGNVENLILVEGGNTLMLNMGNTYTYSDGVWKPSKLDKISIKDPKLSVERVPGKDPIFRIVSNAGHKIQLLCRETFITDYKNISKLMSL